MTISPNRVSKERWELALVAPRSKIKTWGDKYLPTLLVVSKAVMAVIPDPLADKRKVAMRKQPYGMILFHSGLGCISQLGHSIILCSKTFVEQC